jgi:hypothetical protein
VGDRIFMQERLKNILGGFFLTLYDGSPMEHTLAMVVDEAFYCLVLISDWHDAKLDHV